MGNHNNGFGDYLLRVNPAVKHVTGVDHRNDPKVLTGERLDVVLQDDVTKVPLDDDNADTVAFRVALHDWTKPVQEALLAEEGRIVRAPGRTDPHRGLVGRPARPDRQRPDPAVPEPERRGQGRCPGADRRLVLPHEGRDGRLPLGHTDEAAQPAPTRRKVPTGNSSTLQADTPNCSPCRHAATRLIASNATLRLMGWSAELAVTRNSSSIRARVGARRVRGRRGRTHGRVD